MKVVVDTNVLVSGIINPYGKPAKILNMIVDGVLTLCVDSRIFEEYRRVLMSQRFSFPDNYVKWLLEYIEAESEWVVPEVVVELDDIGDSPFAEVACTAGVPLITGNKKSAEFLDIFLKRWRAGE